MLANSLQVIEEAMFSVSPTLDDFLTISVLLVPVQLILSQYISSLLAPRPFFPPAIHSFSLSFSIILNSVTSYSFVLLILKKPSTKVYLVIPALLWLEEHIHIKCLWRKPHRVPTASWFLIPLCPKHCRGIFHKFSLSLLLTDMPYKLTDLWKA